MIKGRETYTQATGSGVMNIFTVNESPWCVFRCSFM